MALVDRLSDNVRPMHGYPCSVGALLEKLEGDELAAFKHMLGTPEQRGWPASKIFDAVKAEGYDVAYQTINKHRGGKCRCAQ